MKKLHAAALFILVSGVLFAQNAVAPNGASPPKFALVIGNGAYTGLSRLTNPVNDANDMTAALQELGFAVDKVLNGNLDQMENAVMRLKNRLSVSGDAYGFFFYAGHGVQSNGDNFLIPADANIPSENSLRNRAISVQWVLDELNDASNRLNVIVLDACRDNPFGWARSGSRGLALVSRQPADSIIVYATSAGQTASDGAGRNGLFTGQLLPNLKIPGLEVKEVFNRTGADVSTVSNRRQIPAVYNQFFGTAFLGERPVVRPPVVFEAGAANVATGALEIFTVTAGIVQIIGSDINQTVELPAWGSLPIEKINAGNYRVVIRYEDGSVEEKTIEIGRSQAVTLEFSYRPAPLPEPAPPGPVRPPREKKPRVIESEAYRLNTLGVSVGTTFAVPMFTAAVHGTISPGRGSFFDLGMDLGFGSGDADVNHFSLYPYVRYALFAPFAKGGGWYIGAGGGLMIATYDFPAEGKTTGYFPAADLSTGFIFGNGITLYYSLRTDFSAAASGKLGLGWSYRFK